MGSRHSGRTTRYALVGQLLVLALLLGATAAIWINRFWLYDTYRLRGYEPPAAIVQLADDTTMRPDARRVFYASRPVLETQGSFTHCPGNEKTVVLGCYTTERSIYLYDVPDSRLDGLEQVTAAHELLHALYERLSAGEQARINQLLDDAFSTVQNERIINNIEAYRKAGADVQNELHSIMASEVRQLPPELEEYYARYFVNRIAIVGYMEQYEAEFTSRQSRIDEYDRRLAELKQQIDDLDSLLVAQTERINAEYQALQQIRQQQPEDYRERAIVYNQSVEAHNQQVRTEQRLVDEYNDIVNQRNELVMEKSALRKALDSRSPLVGGE
ncbi:hypothetical protein CR970_03935 [Candidatus Saccharibacteria bacterium]|nr:MAG: hypothetical protein CR970_03935 [Candidatus Saccharibacteria bacterium]